MSRSHDAAFDHPRANRRFYKHHFHTGEQFTPDIDDSSYPCEYALEDYLRVATAGQEIAVGCFEFRTLAADQLRGSRTYDVHALTAVILPDVGVWLCEPVFQRALRSSERSRANFMLLERVLGRSLDNAPITPAYFAVTDDDRRDLFPIEDHQFFGPEAYADVYGALVERVRDWPRDEVHSLLDELLEAGEWRDAKSPGRSEPWPIPRWLAAQLRMA